MKRTQIEELHRLACELKLPLFSRVSLGLVIRALALECQAADVSAFDSQRTTRKTQEVN